METKIRFETMELQGLVRFSKKENFSFEQATPPKNTSDLDQTWIN